MQIEPGKYYENKRGEKIGPMIWKGGISYPWYADNIVSSFTAEGKLYAGGETAGDLIAEWQDEPAEAAAKAFAETVTKEDKAILENLDKRLAGPILLDWSATASAEYAPLAAILQEAYDQAARGKGRERHANDRAFIDQPILEIGRMCGPGFNTGQSIKKQQEAMGMLTRGEHGAAIRELLGAINYAASAVMLIREQNPGA